MSTHEERTLASEHKAQQLEVTEAKQQDFERRTGQRPYPWEVEAGEFAARVTAKVDEVLARQPEWYVREQAEIASRRLEGETVTEAHVRLQRQAAKVKALRESEPTALAGPRAQPDSTNPKDLIGDLKPQIHLVPAALQIQAALAMANGAAKYGPYNWRENRVRATVYVSAIQRHLLAWLDGEDIADDSGVSHLGHIAAGVGILLDAEATGNLIDDRPARGAASRLLAIHTKEKP
jgi:hypothetical protein